MDNVANQESACGDSPTSYQTQLCFGTLFPLCIRETFNNHYFNINNHSNVQESTDPRSHRTTRGPQARHVLASALLHFLPSEWFVVCLRLALRMKNLLDH
jgi:hypothetical protein